MLEIIPPRKLNLCLGDFIIITLLQIPAFFIIAEKGYIFNFIKSHFWVFLLVPFVWAFVFYTSRVYEVIEETRDKISDTNILIKAAIISIIILGFFFYLLQPLIDFPQRVLLIHGFLVIVILYFWRLIFIKLIHRKSAFKRVLILGTDWPAREIAREIIMHPNLGYALVGFIESLKLSEEEKAEIFEKKIILGKEEEIMEIAEKYQIDLVISALPEKISQKIIKSLLKLQQKGISIVEMPDFYEKITRKIPIEHLRSSWVILGQFKEITKIGLTLESLLNILFAFIFLILFFPLMFITALLIKLEDKGPIFYCQKRVGKKNKIFSSIKFRTMKPEAEKETGPIWTTENDSRITKTGRWLRKWRLDELPQLINVLSNQMVFVGPRPERPEFVEKLEKQIPFYNLRHLVRPGLTGWAQVKFRYSASIRDTLEKLQYDLYYIKHRSFLFDLIIILKTIEVVLTGRGAR